MGGCSGNKRVFHSLSAVTMSLHHSKLDLPIAMVSGFFASFLTFAVSTYQQAGIGVSQLGQLLAGDPVANRAEPTTLNTLQAAMHGEDPLIASMSSFGWWIAVMIGGLIAAALILKMMRRYV